MTNYEYLLADRIRQNIQSSPGKTAYTIGGTATSYAEMGSMAESIASALATHIRGRESSGESPVRIGICLPRDAHYVPCIVAAVLLNCSYVPIDVNTPAERRAYIERDAALSFVITEQNIASLTAAEPLAHLPSFRSPHHEAYMIYTSGTTGRPKGVPVSYRALHSFMQTVCLPDIFNIGETSVILQYASINFDVSVLEIFASLYHCATLAIATDREKYDISLLRRLMTDRHVTFCFMPPSLLSLFPDFDFPDMDTMAAGGEAIPHSVTKRIVGHSAFRFVNGYGPTESTVITTTHHFRREEEWRCIGRALPGVVCHVLDNDLKSVAPGETGELVIGGAQLTEGYWNLPELNARAFFDNPFDDTRHLAPRLYHSGDLVRLNDDGSFDFLGRLDSQVKLHGYRIELAEITACIDHHPLVRRAYTRIEETAGDRHLVAYVSTTGDASSFKSDVEEIRRHAAERLPHYMLPAFWNHVAEFSLNINGKIDPSSLKNRAHGAMPANSRPLTDREQVLVKEVAALIGADTVNIDADLIADLGLSSLQLMRIPADTEPAGFHVTIDDIYTHRTIRRIAESHLLRISFWVNDPEARPDRPVMVFISGHPHFGYCEPVCSRFADRYNIFVIESFHTILNFVPTPLDILVRLYELMVDPIRRRYGIAAYMGYCLGGEQALLLAHRLHGSDERKPPVVVIDGEVCRDTDPAHYIPLNFPSFTTEQNRLRAEIDRLLIATMPTDFRYGGRVKVFLADTFAEQQTITPEEQPTVPTDLMRLYRRRFEEVPGIWRREYPQADISMLHGHHFNVMRLPETIAEIERESLRFLTE